MAIRNLEDGASGSRGAVKVEIKFVCDIDSEEVSTFFSTFGTINITTTSFTFFRGRLLVYFRRSVPILINSFNPLVIRTVVRGLRNFSFYAYIYLEITIRMPHTTHFRTKTKPVIRSHGIL